LWPCRRLSQFFLKNLVGGKDFLWHCKPPHGRSGGIHEEVEEGDFFIKFKLRNKQDGFQWFLVSAVYGATQQEFKEVFPTELVHLCSKETLPMLIGCDFNIIRGSHEKKIMLTDKWPFLFNAIIDAFNLRELEVSRRRFTWLNNLEVLTLEKLDRILSCTEWELKFLHTIVQALSREVSNHTPLFLNTGETTGVVNPPMFKSELGWLLREGFFDLVKDTWLSVHEGHAPLERWQAKVRRLRQYLRGWAKNVSGAYKKEKKLLLNKLDTLDKKAENAHLWIKMN